MNKVLPWAGLFLILPALFIANIYLRPITFIQTVDLDETLPSVTLNDYRILLPIAPLADDYQLVFYDQRIAVMKFPRSLKAGEPVGKFWMRTL